MEIMIQKILVPIDGSEPANRALEFAFDLAQKYSAEILVLTVVQPGKFPPEIMYTYLEGANAFHQKVLAEALEKAKKTVPSLKVTSKLVEGYPADKILEAANEENSDMIVMGRRGQGHIRHTLLGSVSDRVADQSPCTILIVK